MNIRNNNETAYIWKEQMQEIGKEPTRALHTASATKRSFTVFETRWPVAEDLPLNWSEETC